MGEYYSLKIQHACADNSEINGVCKWKREVQEKTSLDTAALKEQEPELYAKYMVTQSDNVRFSVTKYRSYWLDLDDMEDVVLLVAAFLD